MYGKVGSNLTTFIDCILRLYDTKLCTSPTRQGESCDGKAWHLKENMNEEEEKKKEIWKCGGLSRKFQHNEQIRRQSRL